MARPIARPLQGRMPQPRFPADEKKYVIEARINKGMVTLIDAADIEPSALQELFNGRVRYDKTLTRHGTSLFTPTKPDSEAVLNIYTFKKNDGQVFILRFTKDGVYKRGTSSWTPVTGTLTGLVNDRFQIATAFDKCVFTNGVDPIQLIDSSVASFADAGNAPVYKYITSFYNRIIGANFVHATTPNPAQVGWSADGNLEEWDPLADFSAGSAPLVDSPGDLADFITGVVGFSNVLLVLREKSIWLATKQPVASNPFYFYTAVPGKGCDAPHSVAVVPGGIAYVDTRTKKVYVYAPGMEQPTTISDAVENAIFTAISDPLKVTGTYDTGNQEYSIVIPSAGSGVTKVWTYNFVTKAWAYDERLNLTTLNDVEALSQFLAIDDLSGTIEELTGTIEDLSGEVASITTRLYGFLNGDIQQLDLSQAQDSGQNYTTRMVSKNYYLPKDDSTIVKLKFEVDIKKPSTIRLCYSKDLGETWVLAKEKTFAVGGGQLLVWQRAIRSRKFTWKLESENALWELIDYEVHISESGESVGF